MRSTDALSHCLYLSFLPKPGLEPTSWGVMEHHGQGHLKQLEVLAGLEAEQDLPAIGIGFNMVSLEFIWILDSWISLLPSAPQTFWGF